MTIISISNESLTPEKLKESPAISKRINIAIEEIKNITDSVNSWLIYKDEIYPVNNLNIEICDIESYLNFKFKEIMSRKNIKLSFNIQDNLHSIYGDKAIICQQIFGNIISNAIKFSSTDTRIDLSFSNEKDYVVTKIRDYGIGIDSKTIASAFLPYEKISSKGTQGERGAGLGLSLAAILVKRMKGTISIENIKHIDPNQNGTIVTIYFPKA